MAGCRFRWSPPVRRSEVALEWSFDMRSLLLAALAVLTLGAIDMRTAEAGSHWQCLGPDWVCNDSRPAKAAPKAAKKAKAAPAYTAYQPDYAYPQQKKKSKKAPSYAASGSVATGGKVHQTGVASYYWQPQKVASGGWFNPNAMTAAHKTLPFGTKVRVTHLGNGKSVTVTINDRGPYIKGRIIDLSKAAAGVIGMQGQGVARVQVAVLGK